MVDHYAKVNEEILREKVKLIASVLRVKDVVGGTREKVETA